jgi:hypothetical protein
VRIGEFSKESEISTSDIGPMIASLLSEDNRWVNTQHIEVSGGMSI